MAKNNATVELNNSIVLKTTEFQLQKIEEMKRNLPKYIRKRKKQFISEFQEYMEENSTADGVMFTDENIIPMSKLIMHTFNPLIKVAGITPSYSADQISVAFDYYKYICETLLEKNIYIPKVEDFCALINISTATFERYKTSSNDENMREICTQIQDFCVARVTDGAMTGKVEGKYAVFHQKSSNKQSDSPPIQNNTFIQNNTIMTDEQFNDLASKYLSNPQ